MLCYLREMSVNNSRSWNFAISRGILALGIVALGACSSEDSSNGEAADSGSSGSSDSGSGTCENSSAGLNISHFFDDSVAESITEEDCTLADGTETTCYRVVIAGEPSNHDVTTVCPRTIEDEATGLWIVDGEAVPVDGDFIVNVADILGDESWLLHDEATGEVIFTETAEECQTAGGMPIDPNFANFCVECTLEHLGGAMTQEFLIPSQPKLSDTPTEVDRLAPGVSLNGVTIEFPADIAAIESNLNIAPFDLCGGHVNFNIGYHYHEEFGCIEGVPQCDGHAPLIGYARDGFSITEMNDEDGNEPDDLDECRGHTDPERGYHYHAASPGENSFIGCLSGVLVEGDGARGGGGGGGGGPPQR